MRIYNIPEFSSTLEFLTMMALTNGRLLKVFRILKYIIFFPEIFRPIGWNTRPKFRSSTNFDRLEPTKSTLLLNTTNYPSFVDPIDRYVSFPLPGVLDC